MTALQNRLALHRFICREFGYEGLPAMLERLRDVPAGFTGSGESEYARALYLNPNLAAVTPDQLSAYDANIAAHSRKLRMNGEQGREWKPYQYLALLFTEHYLSRYFDDPEKLCADLNKTKAEDRWTAAMPDYQPEDLRTVAFQSATGSGKTLLMHSHILQFQHYLHRSGGRLNNTVLLTPNEQMSAQHERELQASGLRARLFSAEAAADLFSPIEIIDLNKLAEKKGVKRVAVQDFGDNNLVLVDEGHLGASGKVWRERRQELSRGGFTFEYSATFNQVVSKDAGLLNAYGKCLLFDYAYRQFHQDGYGKDYAISNLPSGIEDASSHMYLLGCLLTFYQQCRIWRDKGAQWAAFNLTKPLWVFLGKTVTGASRADKATQSDVVLVLNFLGWVLANGSAVRPMLDNLLAGKSGLPDETGRDYFAGRFGYLNRNPKEDLYADLCDALFHGQGALHVVYLTAGEGELHLRSADNPIFGVVNIGDSTALYKLLVEEGQPRHHRRPGSGVRGAAVRPRGQAGFASEHRDRCAAFHCRLEFLAREHDGADARRRRRRPGDHPDVWARRAPERLEHESEASSGKRGGTTERQCRPPGTGNAVHLRVARQLYADLPRPVGKGGNARRQGDSRVARDLEPGKEIEPEIDPYPG